MAGENSTMPRLRLLTLRCVNCCILVTAVLIASSGLAQQQPKRIGEIEFFGASEVDLDKIRAALPIHEADEFNIEAAGDEVARLPEAIKQITGRAPTDVAPTCCDDHGNLIIFIGLSGKTISYNPRPKSAVRLPKDILNLYTQFTNALYEAVQKGAAAEDRSKGYAISQYAPLRSIELKMREYALHHGAPLRGVLQASSDDQHRAVAAELLGYGRQSRSQMAALARASRDGDSSVRNNATRALLVLVESNAALGRNIPAEDFIDMLGSGTWTDLNKGSFLLSALTRDRNPALLAKLGQPGVRERLIEMARWRTGHAEAARYILGRVAGMAEERLQYLVAAGDVDAIIGSKQGR